MSGDFEAEWVRLPRGEGVYPDGTPLTDSEPTPERLERAHRFMERLEASAWARLSARLCVLVTAATGERLTHMQVEPLQAISAGRTFTLGPDGGLLEMVRVNPQTHARSVANIGKAKAAHARLHAACMAAPRPTEPVEIPPHLLEAFE